MREFALWTKLEPIEPPFGNHRLQTLGGRIFQQISMLLEDDSPIFRQREMISLPRFGHFPARKMAAGKSAPPSGRGDPGFSPPVPPQPS